MVHWESVLSHAVYGGIGLFTTGLNIDVFGAGQASFTILILRSITGVANALTEENNENVQKIYDGVDKITWFFAFPLFVAHLWLKYGTRPEIAYIHPLVALIPFGLYLADKDNEDATAALMLGNAVSAGYVTIVTSNWYGLAATVVFAITHGVVKIETENENVAKEDGFNYLLAIYMLLAWHAW